MIRLSESERQFLSEILLGDALSEKNTETACNIWHKLNMKPSELNTEQLDSLEGYYGEFDCD